MFEDHSGCYGENSRKREARADMSVSQEAYMGKSDIDMKWTLTGSGKSRC